MEKGDVGKTLSALRSPDVGLYGVIPECGETYQSDLAEAKKKKLAAGELWVNQSVSVSKSLEMSWNRGRGKGQAIGKGTVYSTGLTAQGDNILVFKSNSFFPLSMANVNKVNFLKMFLS